MNNIITCARSTFIFLISFGALFLFGSKLKAQVTENFETGSKNSYEADEVNLSSGLWLFDDALLSGSSGDRVRDDRAARIRDGFIQMQFDAEEGAGIISFWGANSGFNGDGNGEVQVYFSTDDGTTWTALGDPISLTEASSLEYYELPADIEAPVRFRLEKSNGGRINIDDITIEPYTELEDGPSLRVEKGNRALQEGDQLELTSGNTGEIREIDFLIRNNGSETLQVESIELSKGAPFSLQGASVSELSSRESANVSIRFQSEEHGRFSDQIVISSNDPDQPEFQLMVEAFAISDDVIIPISEARAAPFGTHVKVAGRVTVGDEFDGPVFFQDETAGIAAFYGPLIDQVGRGDSIHVSGPLTEFNPIGGPEGDFLRQIASASGENEISFEIQETDTLNPEPKVVSISEMKSEQIEGSLVLIENVTFSSQGVFQGDRNYTFSDSTGTGTVRIDGDATSLAGARIPSGRVNITGVVDQFDGTYQLKPRDPEDVNTEESSYPGEDQPKTETFDVVTWNIEWFGDSGRGPDDEDLQLRNVLEVVRTIDADLYAFQEIADEARFEALDDSLDQFRGFIANFSQNQKTAYLFRHSVIDSLDSGLLREQQEGFDWAGGRYPLYFEFDVNIEGQSMRVFSYNIHAKAFDDQESYERREGAAKSLKRYLDERRRTNNVLFLGDFNDMLTESTYRGEISPYINFIQDDHYFPLTLSLEEQGYISFLAGNFNSMIDHIVSTRILTDIHIDGAQRVENTGYIGSFVSTTSDHAPVWTRFDFTEPFEDDFEEIPDEFVVGPNYPNPFNTGTIIPLTLDRTTEITVAVFDVTGREVAVLVEEQLFTAGTHDLRFEGDGLSSGVYFYRVNLATGQSHLGKMVLVK